MKKKINIRAGFLTAAHVLNAIKTVKKADKGSKVPKYFVVHLPKDFPKLCSFVKSNGFKFADKTVKTGRAKL